MEGLLILIGVILLLGLLATPFMLMSALGGIRRLSEQVETLRGMVLRLTRERDASGGGDAVPEPVKAETVVPPVEPAKEETPKTLSPWQPAVPSMAERMAAEPEPPKVAVEPPPAVEPLVETAVETVAEPTVEPEPEKREEDCVPEEPVLCEVLLSKFYDWLAVRGDYAPKGMTREFAVATRWLVRVGLMMLVGSIVYFVKLSIDNGWMGPTARVIATLFWGAVALAGGIALVKRTRYGLLGHACAALGLVALYLGFGLGHRYFTPPVIASWQLAFLALVGVTVAAGIVSVVLPSSTLAVMGLVGGYLVPVVAGRDTGAVMGLCAYLLVLNVGACVVAQLRRWQGLNFLASLFAYGMVFGWCARHSQMHGGTPMFNSMVLLVFLSAVHALYLASSVVMARVDGEKGHALSWLGIALNALCYLSWLGMCFRPATSDSVTGLVFLMVVAVYVAMAWKSMASGWLDAMSVNLLLVFALIFLALAPLLLFPLPWCTVAWALIAVACVEVYHRKEVKVLGYLAGLLLLAASVAGLGYGLDAYVTPWHGMPFIYRLLRLGTVPVAVFWVAYRLKALPLVVISGVMAFLYVTGEAHCLGKEILPMLGGGTVTLTWAIVASACLAVGIVKRLKPARLLGLSLLGVAVGKLLLLDIAPLAVPARVGVFAGVGLLLMAGAFLYLKFKTVFEGENKDE